MRREAGREREREGGGGGGETERETEREREKINGMDRENIKNCNTCTISKSYPTCTCILINIHVHDIVHCTCWFVNNIIISSNQVETKLWKPLLQHQSKHIGVCLDPAVWRTFTCNNRTDLYLNADQYMYMCMCSNTVWLLSSQYQRYKL